MLITKRELANAYKIHPNTLGRKLKAIGIETRNRLTPKELLFIFNELGEPFEIHSKKIA